MGTETSKIALNAYAHLRTANQQMSRPERHVDDITDMRRSCRLRGNTSGRRPLGSSSRLLKVPNGYMSSPKCHVFNALFLALKCFTKSFIIRRLKRLKNVTKTRLVQHNENFPNRI